MGATILSIISALVPIAVKIIMAFLDKKDTDNVTRQHFLDFVDSMEKSMSTPSNLRQSYRKQGDKLRERLKRIKEEG